MKENYNNNSNYERNNKPQRRRFNNQDRRRKKGISFVLGQIFSIIYNLAVLYLVFDLIQSGDKSLALKIFLANSALIAFAIFVSRKKSDYRNRRNDSARRHHSQNRDRRR